MEFIHRLIAFFVSRLFEIPSTRNFFRMLKNYRNQIFWWFLEDRDNKVLWTVGKNSPSVTASLPEYR
jgi:hypothetical protein